MTQLEGNDPVDPVQAAMAEFYAKAFEDGRKQGFAEGVRAAQAHMANMPTSPTTEQALSSSPDIYIEDLDLTVRTYNALKGAGLHTVGDLVKQSEATLFDIRNFGSKRVQEVKDKLADLGYSLAPSPRDFNL